MCDRVNWSQPLIRTSIYCQLLNGWRLDWAYPKRVWTAHSANLRDKFDSCHLHSGSQCLANHRACLPRLAPIFGPRWVTAEVRTRANSTSWDLCAWPGAGACACVMIIVWLSLFVLELSRAAVECRLVYILTPPLTPPPLPIPYFPLQFSPVKSAKLFSPLHLILPVNLSCVKAARCE